MVALETTVTGSRDTPLGPIWVSVAGGAVVASGWGATEPTSNDPVLAQALDELTAYFDGRLTDIRVPIRHGRSGLRGRVLDALRAIPFGDTRLYGDLAKEVDGPPQAVGQACGANPVPILIPCHRVLSATGLGGFSAPGGVETKVWLLKHEGAAGLLI